MIGGVSATPAPPDGRLARPGVLARHVPIVAWLPRYRRKWLAADAIAAVSVWALLVPQSLAYAGIAGVPVQYGLYAAFAALLAYPIFGTSRHLVAGPSATVGAVSFVVVASLVGQDAMGTQQAVGYTAMLALYSGVLYVALGLLHMGWVSTFLSRAVLAGFVLGFAIGIIIDQSAKLLGITGVSGTYAEELWGTLRRLPDTSAPTLAVGASSLALLLFMRYRHPRLPRALIVLALAIVASRAFDLAGHGVIVSGRVPTGLFSVAVPDVGWSESTALAVGALSVIFVGYSESLAAARALALKHHYDIDPNQELIAQGAICGASGLVGGFVVDGSLSKTSVAESAGQRTQMASLINAVLILVTILLLAGLFELLPVATLAAVVIDAMLGLISFAPLRRYYRVNRADWVFFMGAGIGILCFGIIQGILTGVVLSLLLLIARSSRTSVRKLGFDPHTGRYRSVDRAAWVDPIPGLLVARVDGPLFFADADGFRARVQALALQSGQPPHVLIAADAVHFTDTDGADILIQLARELNAQGSRLALTEVHPPVLALWRRAGVVDAVGEDAIFGSLPEAIAALADGAAPASV
jgi:high affinity sulfate transporter 1